jgi:anaerobic dimethyl sulfoxide reductase subunit B (iron-sulfur subunit)
MIEHAFYFDSSACSGCKACQVACKDRHGLKVGLLWRRVYEVAGGGWTRSGQAWLSSVFAYHVSLACNHCREPICAEVCPTRAITRRADGIVLLDPDRCVGCKYCSWACPYGAPQYDDETGTMSKCNFCAADLDEGLPPSCVAACPLRALDFGDREELEARYGMEPGPFQPGHDVIFPLPEPSLTEPALVMTPHREAGRASGDEGQPAAGVRIGNLEEVNAL